MASTDTSPVLRRMLAAAPAQSASGVAAAFKPFAAMLEKLADRSLSMPLGVTSVQQATLSRDALMQGFEAPVVMLRLRAPDGAIGMAGICPQLRAALIEVQTTGKIASTAVSDRPATDADAAICEGFVCDLFTQAQSVLDKSTSDPWAKQFTTDGRFAGLRALGLALDDSPLAHLTVHLDLGQGARQGVLRLLIPQARGRAPAAPNAGWKTALNDAVQGAPVPLTAVLHRRVVPLSDIEGMSVGDLLTLPRSAASSITLESSETRTGPFKLGQIGGQKALRRVADIPDPQPVPSEPRLAEPADPGVAPDNHDTV
ncbi:MAG: FliM/FliN family flagellar motor switch protein [Pseudomonadota bacterium]